MSRSWLSVLRRYLGFILLANLVWEAAHMPLYTLWNAAPVRRIVLYGLHCTAGDVLVAGAALLIALFVLATPGWPHTGYRRVAAGAVVLGLAYTGVSEWVNVRLVDRWAYAPTMPLVPGLGTGLTPLLQWLVLPPIGLWWAHRTARRTPA